MSNGKRTEYLVPQNYSSVASGLKNEKLTVVVRTKQSDAYVRFYNIRKISHFGHLWSCLFVIFVAKEKKERGRAPVANFVSPGCIAPLGFLLVEHRHSQRMNWASICHEMNGPLDLQCL
jgi:hypothetical protein